MKLLSKIFSMPKYLQMPAVGIDISDRSIKYTELKKTKNEYRLKYFGERKIDPGIIESGTIKDDEKLTRELSLLRQETKNDYVIFSLPEEKVFLKVMDLPEMEKSKIRQSIEVQLEEVVPLSAKDVFFDYELVKKNNEQKGLSVALTVFPKNIINTYSEVLVKAGFLPIICEVENQAIARALVPKNQKGTFLIVDFGRTRTSFLIAVDGIAHFTSTISVAGDNLSRSLARVFKIDVFEAERLKQSQSISGRTDEKILSSIIPIVSAIKDEIYRVMLFWQGQCEDRKEKNNEIDKIILCGGDSNMKGLTDFISQNVKKPVELGNPWINVSSFKNYVPEIKRNISLTYVAGIGLALRAFQSEES